MRDWFNTVIHLESVLYANQHLANSIQFADTFIFLFVESGEGRINHNEKSISLKEGDFLLINAGDTYGPLPRSMSMYRFYFQCYQVNESEEKGFIPLDNRFFQTRKGVLPQHLKEWPIQLYKEWQNRSFLCQYRFLEMLYICLENGNKAANEDEIENVKQYIETSVEKVIRLEELAQMFGMTSSYLSEKFKERTGKSITDFTTEVKMTKAKAFLQTEKATIKEIANRLGFADEFYFSRKFKKVVGVSPSQFRQEHSIKVVAFDSSVLGDLIALTQYPIAAPIHSKWTKYYFDHYRNHIPIHLDAYRATIDWETNVEKVKKYKPDMMISKKHFPDRFRENLTINECALLQVDEQKSWQDQLHLIATKLNKNEDYQLFLESYMEELSEGKQLLKLIKMVRPPMILRMYENKMYVYQNRGTRDLFQDFGFSLSKTTGQKLVTVEELATLAPEELWLLRLQDKTTEQHYLELQQTKEWQLLPAVKTNRIISLQSDLWFEYSSYAQLRKVRFFIKQLKSMLNRKKVHGFSQLESV
ncbi:AraC family transcriptional regulator [Alkalihalobacillus sp. 1P02AB]|uniref:AraC family transcriptional regulator n=1 Tax=Alkalihalobacillus sp. 1P02AB TaxID=3132260 RepID=UPI0039A54677